ncbi:restriction endonuclease subunit S [Burkholderia sp. LS-044]|uniref:restriction endonuclease subunit S n=1 Tax=Burkholderia TaxID=32008 RepID=UPI0010A5FB72|nr:MULTISPECIES: restriction endonuclease subunit S [Burkholderia]THJ47340.1 restriction endonuclease subunit S [Burkholderia sp. LS-044]
MSLPSYPAYKDTGIEWLTSVPKNWELSRLGFQSWVRARLGWKGLKAEEYVDTGYAFLATPNIKGKAIDFQNVNYITQERYDESPEIKLAVGDVLLAKDGSTLGTVNVVRELPSPATVNSSIAVITPYASLSGIFLLYLLQSDFLVNTIQRIKGGMGVPHLFQEDLNKFHIPLPPIEEQSIIAAFLDHETAKIDLLVSEQEKLLTLLAEKRQATISHAVTRGLNPDASMKDSGVTWLGMIPAHWEVAAIKHWFETTSGGTPDTGRQDDYYTENGGYPWIRTTDLNNAILYTFEVAITDAAIQDSVCELLPIGSVLVAMYGGEGTIGKNSLLAFEACINQAVCALLPNTSFIEEFTFRYIQFYRPHWMFGAESSRKDPNISQGLIRNIPIVRPPLDEQRSIADFLEIEITKLDKLKANVERTISLLKERRSALISAAVTGRIDVRNAVLRELAA